MTIEIQVTVVSTNHTGGGKVEIIQRFTTGLGNPRYDGDIVRHEVAELGEKIAEQFESLVKDPIHRTTPFGCKCICQEVRDACDNCGHLGCGSRR